MQLRILKRSRAITTLCSLFALTFAVQADIGGSKHDFSTYTWSGGSICGVCHSPHGGDALEAPLWNHEVSSATFTLYDSPTMDILPEQPGPGSVSRICLSCHDGTVAIDSFGGNSGSTFIDDINPNASIGTDLSNDHPIGVYWDHQTSHKACGRCHTLPVPLKFIPRNGRAYVECPTCHDVHNNVANPKLLRLTMAQSTLCLTCHQK